MSILGTKPKLGRDLINPGIIFDHDEVTLMGYMCIQMYMTNLFDERTPKSNEQMVKSFSVTTATKTTPM